MSTHYPRIRVHANDGRLVLREGLSLTFFMRRSHAEVAQAVWLSVEAYCRSVGPQALCWYIDDASEWQPLDERGWNSLRHKLLSQKGGLTNLAHSPESGAAYSLEYYGKPLDDRTLSMRPGAVCALGFRLPTEFLEEHGPARVREVAREVATPLPVCSGYVGLSFHGGLDLLGVSEKIAPLCFRHPGIDVPNLETLGWELGTRFRGPSWLTFLGQPLLGELGGAAALRSRLHASGTTVQELEGDRVIVTLGEWPEAGDTEHGDKLPAYRELARVMEPWLFHNPRGFMPCVRREDTLRWERRFFE